MPTRRCAWAARCTGTSPGSSATSSRACDEPPPTAPVHSVSVDTWGVDYGYIDARGRLIGNPVHYRDTRHEAMLEVAFEIVPRDELYMATGIQFMSINTLYQLLSEVRADDPILEQADKLLMMPDIFNHFLCGVSVCEYTEATTGQTLDPVDHATGPGRSSTASASPPTSCPRSCSRARCWASCSTRSPRRTGCTGTQVVAGASHDTPSAVAAIPLAGPSTAYISSGTWSLVGLEVHRAGRDRGLAGSQPHQRGRLRRHHHAAQERDGPVAAAAEPQGAVARRWCAVVRGDLRAGRVGTAVDRLRRSRRPALPVARRHAHAHPRVLRGDRAAGARSRRPRCGGSSSSRWR